MLGMAELLLDDPSLSGTHRDSVQKIMRSGEILLDMVGLVLDMGKVEAGKLVRSNTSYMSSNAHAVFRNSSADLSG